MSFPRLAVVLAGFAAGCAAPLAGGFGLPAANPGGSFTITGPETFLGEQRGDPRAFAHAMVDAGAALVLASGPHTLRGMEWYHGHLIAYSLGNLARNNTLSTSGTLSVSALLSVTLTSTGALAAAKVIPLRLVGPGTPEHDPTGAAVSMIRTLSDDDFAGQGLDIGDDGTVTVVVAKRPKR